jgi:hypothetical protein
MYNRRTTDGKEGRMNAYAALRITDKHPCPHCGAISGEYCMTSTGERCRDPHVLRINMAKRAAAHGVGGEARPCPTECGDDLTLDGNWVKHVRTGTFECDIAGRH